MTSAKLRVIALMGIGLFIAVGCQRLMNQEAAVQEAIQDHLAARSDLAMDKMTMEVQQVTVNGDTAQADVIFSVPGDSQMRMAYHYELRREGGRWRVDSGRPSASQVPHPPMGEAMGGEMGESMPGGSGAGEPLNLPEGHPPIEQMNPHGDTPLPSTGQ
jgi:hypothetical protein